MEEQEFDGEEFKVMLREHKDDYVKLGFPGIAVGMIFSAIRLLRIHPDYDKSCAGMKSYVESIRAWCKESLEQTGLSIETIEYLDADEKGENLAALEEMKRIFPKDNEKKRVYVLNACPVTVCIIHGAVTVMIQHPKTKQDMSPDGLEIISRIRGICMAAYARMGMSEKNMKHIENEFVEDQCNESHEGIG